MTTPDPADARLLALLAEVGRVAVHDLARRAGMEVREVAARLAGLAASGLPLVVGVECDPVALRHALAARYGPPSGRPPHSPVATVTPAGGYPAGVNPAHHPRAGYVATVPPPAVQAAVAPPPPPAVHTSPAPAGFGRAGFDAAGTWGPPGSAAWARGDGPGSSAPPAGHSPAVGDTVAAEGAAGEPLAIRLVEVVDPADFLFAAAGHRLQPGERSVVVHTEVTNHGAAPLTALPDLHLVLVADDGDRVSKAPVSLSSRPPHRIGVRPGETSGGHTVYVLPEATELVAVRWSARPDDERGSVTWPVRHS